MTPHAKKIQEKNEKKKKVFSYNNIPMRPPIVATIAYALLLDRWGAPGWVWGVFWTMTAIVWGALLHKIATDIYVNAFPEDRDESHHWPATNARDQKEEKVH